LRLRQALARPIVDELESWLYMLQIIADHAHA
jgi:hypothetical protein